jgi:excisionase family DNA binding protein
LDLQDWHKRLELEAKLTKRALDRASLLPKPLPTPPDEASRTLGEETSLALRSGPIPPRKGRGPRKEESREELISRLLDPTLTLDETARLLEVCPTTVRRWTNKGALPCERSAGNQRRFKLSSIEAFLRSRESEIPALREE